MKESKERARRLGEMLVAAGTISEVGLAAALGRQKKEPGRIASQCLALRLAEEHELIMALAIQKGLPGVDLSRSVVPLSVLRMVPREMALQHMVLPLRIEDNRLCLAMMDPSDWFIIDEIQFSTGKAVLPFVALEGTLLASIARAYNLAELKKGFLVGAAHRGAAPPEGVLEQVSPQDEEEEEEESLEVEFSLVEDLEEGEVTVPRATLPQKRPAPPSASRHQALVVDDDEEILKLLTRLLENRQYQVITATRGLEALQKLQQSMPDLIVLDAMLPEIHGFDICRKIKTSKRYSHIPVVMISAVYKGWRFIQDVKESYGADEYIEKPFSIREFFERLDQLMSQEKKEQDQDSKLSQDARECLLLGIRAYKGGQMEEAHGHFARGVGIDPFSPQLHLNLGNVLWKQNKIFNALDAYEAAISISPGLFPALRNLAILYQKKGFRYKALEMWERAMRASPDEASREEIRQRLLKLL